MNRVDTVREVVMCGRFATTRPEQFGDLVPWVDFTGEAWGPRYNVAPGQEVLGVTDQREPQWYKWGLIPSWAKDARIAQKLINARVETLAEKPAFKKALQRQRCLILADGFYEWRKEGKRKVPFFIRRTGGLPFALAGLWEEWSGEGETIKTCTIITTEANGLLTQIHERMPVILTREDCWSWVNEKKNGAEVLGLLRPYSAQEMEMYRVSERVNSATVEGADLMERVEEEQERGEQEKGERGRGKKKSEEPGLWG